jgi:hypothetical protein
VLGTLTTPSSTLCSSRNGGIWLAAPMSRPLLIRSSAGRFGTEELGCCEPVPCRLLVNPYTCIIYILAYTRTAAGVVGQQQNHAAAKVPPSCCPTCQQHHGRGPPYSRGPAEGPAGAGAGGLEGVCWGVCADVCGLRPSLISRRPSSVCPGSTA